MLKAEAALRLLASLTPQQHKHPPRTAALPHETKLIEELSDKICSGVSRAQDCLVCAIAEGRALATAWPFSTCAYHTQGVHPDRVVCTWACSHHRLFRYADRCNRGLTWLFFACRASVSVSLARSLLRLLPLADGCALWPFMSEDCAGMRSTLSGPAASAIPLLHGRQRRSPPTRACWGFAQVLDRTTRTARFGPRGRSARRSLKSSSSSSSAASSTSRSSSSMSSATSSPAVEIPSYEAVRARGRR